MNCLQTNGRTADNRRSEKLTPELRSAKRGPANVRRLNNISDVNFYCSGARFAERSTDVTIRAKINITAGDIA